MAELTFTSADDVRHLKPGEELSFGRDNRCDVVVGADDRGVSRVAGVVRHSDGVWWLLNMSGHRALHVVDDTGYATPLPVVVAGMAPSRRAIFAPGFTVLLAGEVWTYSVSLATEHLPSAVTGPVPVQSEATFTSGDVALTAKRKEALVALLSGYLKPVPRYDPRPLSYSEAGEVADLAPSTVRKRIEDLRNNLVRIGVAGLTGDDSPRRLAEWSLATRMVTPADLEWLRRRVEERAGTFDTEDP